jgi:hypothetical protein
MAAAGTGPLAVSQSSLDTSQDQRILKEVCSILRLLFFGICLTEETVISSSGRSCDVRKAHSSNAVR